MLAFQVTCFGCVCFPSINIYAFEMALMLMESKFWNRMCDYLQSWIWNAKCPAGRKKNLCQVSKSFSGADNVVFQTLDPKIGSFQPSCKDYLVPE